MTTRHNSTPNSFPHDRSIPAPVTAPRSSLPMRNSRTSPQAAPADGASSRRKSAAHRSRSRRTAPASSQCSFADQFLSWRDAAGIPSWQALAEQAGLSLYQVRQLRQGSFERLRFSSLAAIAQTLNVPLPELVAAAYPDPATTAEHPRLPAHNPLQHWESQQLQTALQQQKRQLLDEFQQAGLHTLEPWMLQWYRAVAAIQKNPQLPAMNLIPLMRPIESLLEQWGVTQIAIVGDEVSYNPQWHQMSHGIGQAGDHVRVVMPGFRQGDRLLHRAQVVPIRLILNP